MEFQWLLRSKRTDLNSNPIQASAHLKSALPLLPSASSFTLIESEGLICAVIDLEFKPTPNQIPYKAAVPYGFLTQTPTHPAINGTGLIRESLHIP